MTVTFLVKIILKKFTFKYVVTSFLEILESHFTLVCLYMLMLYVPVNNFSVMFGHFLG